MYACTEKTGTQTHIMTAGSWSGQQATQQMGSLLLQASRCSGVVQAARLFPATPACKSARFLVPLSLFLYVVFLPIRKIGRVRPGRQCDRARAVFPPFTIFLHPRPFIGSGIVSESIDLAVCNLVSTRRISLSRACFK